MVPEKIVTQSQGELVALLTTLLGIVAASGRIALTPEQIGAIVAFLGILAGIVRYGSSNAKLVFKKSKIMEDLEKCQLPCSEDINADIGLLTVEADKIKAAMVASGASEAQILAFLNALGMDSTQTQVAVTALKRP